MSDEPPQPDWQRLPHDPRGFFQLDDEFDRKQLKRSYNRFIRRFKPETHPEEFQRIRGAYEQLDQMLRYGGGLQQTGELHFDTSDNWASPSAEQSPLDHRSAPNRSSTNNQPSPAPLPLELHERLDQEPPAELYTELRNKPDKRAYDYYALALLSDVCDRRDGLQFVRWLLEGIKAHPRDAALKWLLQAYFRGPITNQALPKLLVAAAQAIGDDSFYLVSEPGWDVLLRSQSLDTFVATLGKCQTHLREIGIAGKVTFFIRMLRAAFWKKAGASPQAQAWTDEAIDFIEANFEQIPGELDFEVDLLSMVHQYLPLREAFVGNSEFRKQLDKTLERYFTSDPVAGDRAVVEMHLCVASNANVLLAAFAVDQEDDAVDAFYSTWAWVGYEVDQRCGVADVDEPDIELWNGRAHALLVQLEAKSDSSTLGQFWNWSGIALRIAQMLCYVVSGALAFALVMSAVLAVTGDAGMAIIPALVAMIAAGFFGGRWLSNQLLQRIYTPYCHRMARRCYNTLWRREAVDMLNRSRLPYTLLRDLIAHQASPQISTSRWVSSYITQDYALAIYAMALRHVV